MSVIGLAALIAPPFAADGSENQLRTGSRTAELLPLDREADGNPTVGRIHRKPQSTAAGSETSSLRAKSDILLRGAIRSLPSMESEPSPDDETMSEIASLDLESGVPTSDRDRMLANGGLFPGGLVPNGLDQVLTGSIASPGAPTRHGRVNANVDLRRDPSADAPTLAVLPKGWIVEFSTCGTWCRVTADGTSGYVLSHFIDRPSRGG